MTDPEDNVISYEYDNAGRRTSQSDPDAGDWSYTYDDVGNQLTVTDALSHTITTDYDVLNRPTRRHEGTTDLAEWEYDATGEEGLLDRSIRHAGGEEWVTDVAGYDVRNRPTGTTLMVPAGVPGLSGTYTTSYGYNLADQPTSIGYPAAGGLVGETVTTGYHNTLGLPATMSGTGGYTDTYAGVAFYDDRARPSLFGYGLYSGQYTLGRTWGYDGDQRLASVSNAAGGLEATRHDMVYDPLGNITQRTTKLGADDFRECFTYDPYQRLTRAVTTAPATACSTNPTTAAGDLAYEQDFLHGDDGNLVSRNDGTGPVVYDYPASGSARPHAPTAVGGDTYAWDANGNLDSRTVDGVTTDFTFDHEHNLASVTSPSGTSEFVYDANGQRLYQKTPTGSTLYLEGQEVHATPGATPTVTATRLYSFAGQLVATRTAAAGVDYMVTDHQGSVEAKVDAAGTIVTAHRAYKPYGETRAAGGFATQRGWIGQIHDPTTGLNYLNARYYDPDLARFISPDPLYNPNQPKSLNPYTYAWANPVTGSDPSGLLRDCECYNPPPPPCGCGGADNRSGGSGGGGGSGGAGSSGLVPKPTSVFDDSGQVVLGMVNILYDYVYDERDIGGQLHDALAACEEAQVAAIAEICEVYNDLYHVNASGDYSDDELEDLWRERLAGVGVEGALSDNVVVSISLRARLGDETYGTTDIEAAWDSMAAGVGGAAMAMYKPGTGLSHAEQRHTWHGGQTTQKSVFFDGVRLDALSSRTAGRSGFSQANGNIRYVLRGESYVGVDRTTGLPTDIYTVIRTSNGGLITLFPGTSAKG